jgi:hypothetical protein
MAEARGSAPRMVRRNPAGSHRDGSRTAQTGPGNPGPVQEQQAIQDGFRFTVTVHVDFARLSLMPLTSTRT